MAKKPQNANQMDPQQQIALLKNTIELLKTENEQLNKVVSERKEEPAELEELRGIAAKYDKMKFVLAAHIVANGNKIVITPQQLLTMPQNYLIKFINKDEEITYYVVDTDKKGGKKQ